MKVKLTGFYQQPNALPVKVDFDELFDISFMRKFTKFRSFDRFLAAASFTISSQQDFEALPEEDMDRHVRANTKFSSWKEMMDFATDKYVLRKNND